MQFYKQIIYTIEKVKQTTSLLFTDHLMALIGKFGTYFKTQAIATTKITENGGKIANSNNNIEYIKKKLICVVGQRDKQNFKLNKNSQKFKKLKTARFQFVTAQWLKDSIDQQTILPHSKQYAQYHYSTTDSLLSSVVDHDDHDNDADNDDSDDDDYPIHRNYNKIFTRNRNRKRKHDYIAADNDDSDDDERNGEPAKKRYKKQLIQKVKKKKRSRKRKRKIQNNNNLQSTKRRKCI